MKNKNILMLLMMVLFVPATGQGQRMPFNGNIAGMISTIPDQGELDVDDPKFDVSNTIVYIKEIRKEVFVLPKENPVIEQFRLRYSPFVLPLVQGTTVDFINKDPDLHTITIRKGFWGRPRGNYGMPGKRTEPRRVSVMLGKRFSPNGNPYHLTCHTHCLPMEGFIYVLQNPYFTMADWEGYFELGDVPAGEYVLVAEHPYFGRQEKRISLVQGGAFEIQFLLQLDDERLGQFETNKRNCNKSGERAKKRRRPDS